MQREDGNDIDELFEVKTYYYIGAYQQCLNEINKLSKVQNNEKEYFMWRSYLAQNKYRIILDGIQPSEKVDGKDSDLLNVNEIIGRPFTNSDVLLAIRKLADYCQNPDNRNDIIKYLDAKFNDGKLFYDQKDNELDPGKDLCYWSWWSIVAATCYYKEGLYENALKVISGKKNLECLAFEIQCLLKMNRLDLAKQVLVKMQEKDDDATLTQLSTAWINIEIGGEKLQDAYYIFQDFCDKFMTSTMLMNAQAVCFIGQEKFDQAKDVLQDCLNKDSSDYDTLINLMVLTQLQSGERNSGTFNRYLIQLKDSHKNSPLMEELKKNEADFQRLCLKYEPSVRSSASVGI